MRTFLTLAPVFIFLIAMLALGFIIQKRSEKDRAKDFSKDYYIGGRSLGGFVLAMTLVATYSSVSSFVGGPGMAWQRGFGWVYYAMTQCVAAFLVLGVTGKKMAVLGRKVEAVTVVDMVRARYQSNALANICAVVLVIFFSAAMMAQFMGGAQLFAAAAGVDYKVGLLIFAVVVVAFTAIGGFKAVAITDTVCAIVMLLGMAVIAYAVMSAGGGISGVMATINEQPHMLEPTAGGQVPVQLFITQWMLCGVCTLGLPQSLVRNLSYKNSKALHQAMVYGTIVVGAMMLGMHLLGVLSRGVILEAPAGGTDAVMPTLIVNYMHPIVAGIAIIGPLAATMSTVSSQLIAASSAIMKDLYQHAVEMKGQQVEAKKMSTISILATAIIGVVCVVMAINPPTVIVWVNMFAFGGLQTAFFFTFLFGLFWSKANKTGAVMGVVGGVAVYCIWMAAKLPTGGFHQILFGMITSLVLFVIGSYIGKPSDEKVLKLFFPEKYPDGTIIEVPRQI